MKKPQLQNILANVYLEKFIQMNLFLLVSILINIRNYLFIFFNHYHPQHSHLTCVSYTFWFWFPGIYILSIHCSDQSFLYSCSGSTFLKWARCLGITLEQQQQKTMRHWEWKFTTLTVVSFIRVLKPLFSFLTFF